MFPEPLVTRLESNPIIAVVTIDDPEDAVPLGEALLAGGIRAVELTLRNERALDALARLKHSLPEMIVGAGTVLTVDQVKHVVETGADFGVSPGLNPRIVKAANQTGLPFAPGVQTPSDIEAAVELGCRLLKFFPADTGGGLTYLRSIAAPFAHLGLRYIPLGGITLNSALDYLRESWIPAIGGSWVAPRERIRNREWSVIAANAREATEALLETEKGVPA